MGKRLVRFGFFLALHFGIPAICLADPIGGGDPEEVPIDGGLSLLIAGGAALGARRLWQDHKKGVEE